MRIKKQVTPPKAPNTPSPTPSPPFTSLVVNGDGFTVADIVNKLQRLKELEALPLRGMKVILRNNAKYVMPEEAMAVQTRLQRNGFAATVIGSDWEPIFPPQRQRFTQSRSAHIPRQLRLNSRRVGS